jgi:MFS family permease
MALYITVFIGTTPIGGPVVGFLAEHFGPRAGLAVGGVATALAGAALLWAVRRGAPQPVLSREPAAPPIEPAVPAS